MKRTMLVGAGLLVIGFAGHSFAGVPKGPLSVTPHFSDIENVDCRRYPHRHRNAKPHGFGFGCPKRPRTKATPPKKTKA